MIRLLVILSLFSSFVHAENVPNQAIFSSFMRAMGDLSIYNSNYPDIPMSHFLAEALVPSDNSLKGEITFRCRTLSEVKWNCQLFVTTLRTSDRYILKRQVIDIEAKPSAWGTEWGYNFPEKVYKLVELE